jgi:protein phosphatase
LRWTAWGEITAEQARSHPQRSLVLRALDGTPELVPALNTLTAQPGDRLLLCSDGVSDSLDDDAIATALRLHPRRAAADRLIDLALDAGARDNVSAVVADVIPVHDPAAGWQR